MAASRESPASRPYHHGDLCAALVQAGLELARSGGSSAVSLREATRRAGVTPSAAYRHFRDRSHLLDAVAREIQDRMAVRMRHRMRATRQAPAGERALRRLRGVGLGYIAFAREEPGWFETAFFGSLRESRPTADGVGAAVGGSRGAATGAASAGGTGGATAGGTDSRAAGSDGEGSDAGGSDGQSSAAAGPESPAARVTADGDATADPRVPPPFALLVAALDECVEAGVLVPQRRPGAEFVCWSAVHGCAELVLHGPLRGAERAVVRQVAERVVDDIITGIR